MTPSINRLSESAKALGKHNLEAELDNIKDEFANSGITDLEFFKRWITGYMYYHALVCASEGQIGAINSQLEKDFNELMQDI